MKRLKIRLKLFCYECMLIDALNMAKISGDGSYDLSVRFFQFNIYKLNAKLHEN